MTMRPQTNERIQAKENSMKHVGNGVTRALAGFVVLVATAGSAQNAVAATCGDLNGNGSVTTADVTKLRRVIAGLDPAPAQCGGMGALQCGDIRADGSLAPNDVVVLLNFLSGNPLTIPICQGQGPAIARGTVVSGTVNSNQTWTGGGEVCCAAENAPADITLDGTVFVAAGVTLTINPGTVIKGKKSSSNGSPSVLVFLKGSKINAPGRSDCPIIITSDQAPGNRNSGDIGGIVFNGNAPTNCSGTGAGGCFAEGLTNVPFGGNDPNDSSGVMRFVRVEFSGIEISPDNELNVITANGVGAASQFDHLQANTGGDDCFEWFGGTLSEKFLVASGCGDDMFDTQLGTVGSFQFAFGAEFQANLQAGNGNNSFEWDDNENNQTASPLNHPKFCNLTAMGTKQEAGASGGSGALLRRGTNGKIANTIFTKFFTSGIQFNDQATMAQACTKPGGTPTLVADPLTFRNSILFDNGPAGNVNLTSTLAATCTAAEWYNLMTGNNPATAAGTGTNPFSGAIAYPTSVADVDSMFVPPTPGAADGGVDCATQFNAIPFTTFTPGHAYIGAFQPGSPTTWLDNTSCWISFAKH